MDKAHKETDKILAKLEKNIEELYSDALRELKSKLNTLISRIDTTKEPQQIYNQLQQKKRLEAIIREMSLVVNNANKVAMDIMNDDMIDIYSLNYNWGAYEVEKAVAKDIGYTLYNRNAIKLLLKEEINPFTLMAIDDLTDKTILYKELKRALASGLLQGESMQKIASRIKKITDKNQDDSLRIARTETTRIENVGRLDSYKFAEKQGLKIRKSWLATMDKRTRETHQRVNGEIVDLDKPFSNGLMYPGDPNGGASEVIRCRCTMTTEFIGFEKGEKEKELDETLRKMSFEEWQERKKKK